MIISENLKKSNIIIKAKSENRWELIQEMLDLAVKNKEVKEEDRETVGKALIEREKSMSTGIGKGVAIPHCTTSVIDQIVIIIALCENGINFDSIDNQPVKIVILLLVPKNKLTQHIKTLANIARTISNDELRKDLLSVKNQEKIIKTIREHEKNI
ncbi:MAG: PTS sugar transporter subunit IIA [Spirochaetota bacterium]|nr:PTS sugar transporter subunit IIA [Spirochaetota bacterium]